MLPLRVTGAIVRRRGKTLLGPVNFELAGTGLTVVIGPNGSGKTTLLRVMHGIERLTAGQIAWAVPMAEARQRQAYVFQQPTMLRRSVADNLAFPLRLSGQPQAQARKVAAEWACRIGLGAALDRPALRLSGGERQKLALARALIRSPKVLFLDEPCANLDGRATRDIEALLVEVRDAGTRIVLATHDMGQARRLATEGVFLRSGQVWESGTTLLTAPQTPELTAFLKGDIVL